VNGDVANLFGDVKLVHQFQISQVAP
jgi:hypothetical protein